MGLVNLLNYRPTDDNMLVDIIAIKSEPTVIIIKQTFLK